MVIFCHSALLAETSLTRNFPSYTICCTCFKNFKRKTLKFCKSREVNKFKSLLSEQFLGVPNSISILTLFFLTLVMKQLYAIPKSQKLWRTLRFNSKTKISLKTEGFFFFFLATYLMDKSAPAQTNLAGESDWDWCRAIYICISLTWNKYSYVLLKKYLSIGLQDTAQILLRL